MQYLRPLRVAGTREPHFFRTCYAERLLSRIGMATNWFPHDASARNDGRILMLRAKFGWEGYGLYFALLECMYETADAKLNANALPAYCLSLGTTAEQLEAVVGYCIELSLFVREEDVIYSERLVAEKKKYLEKSKAARESAERRWKKRGTKPKNANALQTQSEGNAPPTIPTTHNPESRARESLKKKSDVHMTDDDLGREFRATIVRHEWCSDFDSDKVWSQGMSLHTDDRREFLRKARVVVNAAKHPRTEGLARKIYYEIAGFVNDRGAMQSKISPQEIEARRIFREETGQSLDVA